MERRVSGEEGEWGGRQVVLVTSMEASIVMISFMNAKFESFLPFCFL